uniref:Glycoprotein hormone subunit beta domain-containing protein n=1 Tax=Astyanax mexicanus TaxID=7994 RepID=A0A8B9KLQ9_ASTMX
MPEYCINEEKVHIKSTTNFYNNFQWKTLTLSTHVYVSFPKSVKLIQKRKLSELYMLLCLIECDCISQGTNYRNPVVPNVQNTCNFREWTYETVQLTGCPAGVDSSFTYPVALSCECSQCNTDSTDCGLTNQNFCCNQLPNEY